MNAEVFLLKKRTRIMIASLIAALMLVTPFGAALAELMTSSGRSIEGFATPDSTDVLGLWKIDGKEPVDFSNNRYGIVTGSGIIYFRASDLSVVGATPVPVVTPTPTPVPGAPTPTPNPYASATPEPVTPTRDPSYQGTILNFTVPIGGLSLYGEMHGTVVVQVASAGTKLTLNMDNPPTGWYYTYYKGNTYYVPQGLLNADQSGDNAADLSKVKSLHINMDTPLYSTSNYDLTTHDLKGLTSNTLPGGTRVNVKYVKTVKDGATNVIIYQYTIGSVNYYFVENKTTMNRSTATVGSSADTDMMTRIVIPFDGDPDDPSNLPIRVYITKSTSTSNYHNLTTNTVLYGSNLGDGWYKVTYNGATYYMQASDVARANSQMVANSGEIGDGRFYITAGANGMDAYYSRKIHTGASMVGGVAVYGKPIDFPGDPCNPVHPVNHYWHFGPGETLLVGTYDSNWYTFTDPSDNKLYYIYRGGVADSVSGGSMSSKQVYLNAGTPLYKKLSSSPNTFEPSTVTIPEAGYYVIREENLEYYLFVYQSQNFYVKKTDAASTPTPIGSTVVGKTYTVTIGQTGAALYASATCTGASVMSLQAGAQVSATKYSETVYTVSSGGAKYYMRATDIVSVKGGDDPSATYPGDGNTGVDDVYKGETDPTFAETVFSYKVPAGGLWLYSTYLNYDAKAVNLSAGTTVKFNTFAADLEWYSTWYNGSQYYVPKSLLKVSAENTNTSGTYSITLVSSVTLYTSGSVSTYKSTLDGKTYEKLPDNAKTSIVLGNDTKINVSVASKYATSTDKGVRVYRYVHFDGKTYYFLARSGPVGEPPENNVDTSNILAATISSNTDASLITKFDMGDNIIVYSAPNKNSQILQISAGYTVYGKSHNTDWYQIVYQNMTWYMFKADFAGHGSSEQIAIAGTGVGSSTATVVIGPTGARLYTMPQTNPVSKKVGIVTYPPNTENWKNCTEGLEDGMKLDAGDTVLASSYNSTWYTIAVSGETLYFMNNASNVTNTSANTAIKSYTIYLQGVEEIPLYATVSDIVKPTLDTIKAGEGGAKVPYTLRYIDSKWSSIVYFGRTYFIKNNDIDVGMKTGSASIASTSVGGTYLITIGRTNTGGSGTVSVYGDAKLSVGNVIGSLEVGRQVNGTKMYVENAKTLSSQCLVYSIPFGSRTGYIDAAYVSGVKEGDEVAEAKKAAQDAANQGGTNEPIAIGAKAMYTINAGTVVYRGASTTAETIEMPSTTTLELTKVSATWYQITSWSAPGYIPAAAIEKGGNAGSSASVGSTFSLTFLDQVNMYGSMDSTKAAVGFISVGDIYTLKKISDLWYELSVNGVARYVQVADVRLPASGTGGTQGQTTDASGAIITDQVMITPSSGTVNLRREANTTSTILERIPKGTVVTNNKAAVTDKNGQRWYSVTYNGVKGYVIGTYVTAVGTAGSSDGTFIPNPLADIGKVLTVNTSSVNIRSDAGTGFPLVGTLTKGYTVVPLDYKTGSDGLTWYKFMFNSNTVGYIRSDFLAGSSATAGISGNVAIRVGDTNLRSGSGENFSLIMKLPRDTIVTIIGSGTDNTGATWYNIVYENLRGYVRADLVRPLTNQEATALGKSIVGAYKQLQQGDKGPEVTALQQQLILTGYLTNSTADGSYGPATTAAVKSFQSKNGLTANGVATPQTQQALFNTKAASSGGTQALDWFAIGFSLLNKNKVFQVYDVNTGTTWTARYINGSNHADVIPNSKADAMKLTAANITGSYVRRPVICTIAGMKYAGSMYAVGHGSSSYCDYFSGVMCIHFSGSKTHGTGNVDADHQAAIGVALTSGF